MRALNNLKASAIIASGCLITMIPSSVFAENEGGDVTIHSYGQFRNMFSKADSPFRLTFNKIVRLAWSIGLILMSFAFVMLMIGLAVNAGKLGSFSSNPSKRQEAYEGILHTAINFAILGAAPLVFGTIMRFYTGS